MTIWCPYPVLIGKSYNVSRLTKDAVKFVETEPTVVEVPPNRDTEPLQWRLDEIMPALKTQVWLEYSFVRKIEFFFAKSVSVSPYCGVRHQTEDGSDLLHQEYSQNPHWFS